MRLLFVMALLLSATVSAVASAQTPGDERLLAELTALERSSWEATLKDDKELFRTYMVPEFKGFFADGTVAGRLSLPVSQVTCVAFGGPALDLLFVTSASEGLDRSAEPHAGDVLVYEGPFQGLPAGRFRLG